MLKRHPPWIKRHPHVTTSPKQVQSFQPTHSDWSNSICNHVISTYIIRSCSCIRQLANSYLDAFLYNLLWPTVQSYLGTLTDAFPYNLLQPAVQSYSGTLTDAFLYNLLQPAVQSYLELYYISRNHVITYRIGPIRVRWLKRLYLFRTSSHVGVSFYPRGGVVLASP